MILIFNQLSLYDMEIALYATGNVGPHGRDSKIPKWCMAHTDPLAPCCFLEERLNTVK